MSDKLRLTLAQLNPTLGDLAGNRAKAAAAHLEAAKAALALFPAKSPRVGFSCASVNRNLSLIVHPDR